MELHVYSTDLNPLGIVDEIKSLIWIRRYWSVGEFKLLAPVTPNNTRLLQKNNLLMKKGDDSTAQIKYVHIDRDLQGLEVIEVQGKFISEWLDTRVVLNKLVTTDNSQNIMNELVYRNIVNPTDLKRKIPLVEIADQTDEGSGIIDFASESMASVLDTVEKVSKSSKLGFKIQTDIGEKQHYFSVYKGRDLTASQSENKPCIFSKEFDNVYEQEFTNSVENLKTNAYVISTDLEGNEVITVVGNVNSGLDRIEVAIDASDLTQTYLEDDIEKTLDDETFHNMLVQRGEKVLGQYTETLNFNCKVNTKSNLKYKVDFDLGDRVTCIDKKWNVIKDVRITEITETYQQKENDIEVTFGESLPTLIDKLKMDRQKMR